MFINLHTHHPSDSSTQYAIVNCAINTPSRQLPALYSAGLHPWYINNDSIDELDKLRQLFLKRRPTAIGECGLDKLKGQELKRQTEIFKAHINLSEELEIPMIIHCIKAYSEIIKLKKDTASKQAWIFHGFNASKETAEQALKHGFYFSFGQSLLNEQSKASKVLPFIPTDRLFLETDDNPQLNIQSIYQKTSQLLNIDTPQLQVIIKNNFNHLFNVD